MTQKHRETAAAAIIELDALCDAARTTQFHLRSYNSLETFKALYDVGLKFDIIMGGSTFIDTYGETLSDVMKSQYHYDIEEGKYISPDGNHISGDEFEEFERAGAYNGEF